MVVKMKITCLNTLYNWHSHCQLDENEVDFKLAKKTNEPTWDTTFVILLSF